MCCIVLHPNLLKVCALLTCLFDAGVVRVIVEVLSPDPCGHLLPTLHQHSRPARCMHRDFARFGCTWGVCHTSVCHKITPVGFEVPIAAANRDLLSFWFALVVVLEPFFHFMIDSCPVGGAIDQCCGTCHDACYPENDGLAPVNMGFFGFAQRSHCSNNWGEE